MKIAIFARRYPRIWSKIRPCAAGSTVPDVEKPCTTRRAFWHTSATNTADASIFCKQSAPHYRLKCCWQCDDFQACETLGFLEEHHGTAHLKNLRKLRKQGRAAFIKGKRYWYTPT